MAEPRSLARPCKFMPALSVGDGGEEVLVRPLALKPKRNLAFWSARGSFPRISELKRDECSATSIVGSIIFSNTVDIA